MFGGDHLLPHITPSLGFESFGDERGRCEALPGVAGGRSATCPARHCPLPGHGPVFDDLRRARGSSSRPTTPRASQACTEAILDGATDRVRGRAADHLDPPRAPVRRASTASTSCSRWARRSRTSSCWPNVASCAASATPTNCATSAEPEAGDAVRAGPAEHGVGGLEAREHGGLDAAGVEAGVGPVAGEERGCRSRSRRGAAGSGRCPGATARSGRTGRRWRARTASRARRARVPVAPQSRSQRNAPVAPTRRAAGGASRARGARRRWRGRAPGVAAT